VCGFQRHTRLSLFTAALLHSPAHGALSGVAVRGAGPLSCAHRGHFTRVRGWPMDNPTRQHKSILLHVLSSAVCIKAERRADRATNTKAGLPHRHISMLRVRVWHLQKRLAHLHSSPSSHSLTTFCTCKQRQKHNRDTVRQMSAHESGSSMHTSATRLDCV
jgi:hypothetical protein